MQQYKVAIVMFGITRSLAFTIQSLQEHIFNIFDEKNIKYDIFQHTYLFRDKYYNMWTKEDVDEYPNEDYKHINALKRDIEYQEDVIETIDFDEYYTQPTTWTGEWDPELGKHVIRNMVLGYRSRKHAFQLLEPNLKNYTHVLFIRPDIHLTKSFDLNIFTKINNESNLVVIPEQDCFNGCNDKLLFCNSVVASKIGNLYEYLLPYSQKHSIVAETFLSQKLDEHGLKVFHVDWPHITLRLMRITS
jgi:hypothetical protein